MEQDSAINLDNLQSLSLAEFEELVGLPEDPIANINFNSYAAILRTTTGHHWLSDLKTCEVEIARIEAALGENFISFRKTVRHIQKEEEELKGLELVEYKVLTTSDRDRIQEIKEKLWLAGRSRNRLDASIRDALMELETLKARKRQILDAHPEIQASNYLEIQQRHSSAALIDKLSDRWAAARIAQQLGVPEEVAQILVESPEEDRLAILQQGEEKVFETMGRNAVVSGLAQLSTLPMDLQEAVIAEALKILETMVALEGVAETHFGDAVSPFNLNQTEIQQ